MVVLISVLVMSLISIWGGGRGTSYWHNAETKLTSIRLVQAYPYFYVVCDFDDFPGDPKEGK